MYTINKTDSIVTKTGILYSERHEIYTFFKIKVIVRPKNDTEKLKKLIRLLFKFLHIK